MSYTRVHVRLTISTILIPVSKRSTWIVIWFWSFKCRNLCYSIIQLCLRGHSDITGHIINTSFNLVIACFPDIVFSLEIMNTVTGPIGFTWRSMFYMFLVPVYSFCSFCFFNERNKPSILGTMHSRNGIYAFSKGLTTCVPLQLWKFLFTSWSRNCGVMSVQLMFIRLPGISPDKRLKRSANTNKHCTQLIREDSSNSP